MRNLFLCLAVGATSVYAQDAAQEGRSQFTKTCSFCHGTNATGGAEGPNLMLSSLVRHDKDGELIGEVIREGRPSKGMPAFSLSQSQITNLVAYLHARLKENDLRSPKRPKDYAVKLLLTGNATGGKAFFAQHCASCHSPTGDLKGIASRLEPTDLQAQMLSPNKVPEPVTITSATGHITGTLIYQDPFTIEMRDGNGQFHSWQPSEVKIRTEDPLAAHKRLVPVYTEEDLHDVFAYLETLR